jgi:hypothetical protein
MSTRIELVTAAIDSVKPALGEIYAAEAALETQKDKVAAIVAAVIDALPEYTGDDDEDEMDDLNDTIGDFASSLGMTWSGDWNCGSGWEPGGEAVEFWVPSTC